MEPLHPKRRARKGNAIQARPKGADASAGGISEFTQLALWMAASLAGMVTALILARRPFFEALLRKVGGGGPGTAGGGPVPLPSARQSLPMLAEAIVGSTKAAVASVFGPPRSAAVRGTVRSGGKAPAYWQATTWYYPLPRNDAMAMAIEFDEDGARRVEFFRAPGL